MSVETRTLNERAERKPRKESVGRAKGENKARKVSWRELKANMRGVRLLRDTEYNWIPALYSDNTK